MTADEFRNALVRLNCIDADEFTDAIIRPANSFVRSADIWGLAAPTAIWNKFQENPVKFYIHASARDRSALFEIIRKHLTTGDKND